MLEFISIHCANAHIHMSVIMILGIGFHCKRYTATQIQHSVLNPYLCPPTTARTLIKYVFSTNVSKPILRWNFQAENLRNSHYGIVIDTHIHNNDDDFKKNRTLSRADLFRADFFFAFIKFFYLENFRDLIYSLQAFAIFLINLCLSLWVRLWWFTFFFETLVKMLNLFFLRNKWRFLLFLPPDLRHTRASTHIGVHILCKGPHLLKWACRKHFFDFKAIKIVRCSQRFLNKFQR